MKITGIVGTGAMGAGIAQVAASADEDVLIFDSFPGAAEKGLLIIRNNLEIAVEKGKISAHRKNDILSRIRLVSNLGEYKDCTLVVEAVVENLDIKKKVFEELGAVISDHCLVGSNTSSLSIASLAGHIKNPGRMAGVHFFNPAHLMPLVEIIPGIQSDPEVAGKLIERMKLWGKVPVLAKDTPGFIVNRIARPFYGEAIRIFEEGFASYEDIDFAVKEQGGFKMGPFELMDLIGNDINFTVTETVWKQMFFNSRYQPSQTQKRLFESGRFGRKSGQGFYNYKTASSFSTPGISEQLRKDIFWRILVMLINEAADALFYGIASRDDIDLAMTKGVNYPKGLLKWADEIGINHCLETMERLFDEYKEERYRPSVQFKKMIRENKNFYA